MRKACVVFAAVLGTAEAIKPQYVSQPNELWARKPHRAISKDNTHEFQVPVMYAPIKPAKDTAEEDTAPKGESHVRSGDEHVVIHHGSDLDYNAGGKYEGGSQKDGKKCCQVCPRSEKSSYSTCATVCGPQCEIPEGAKDCTLGVDCGMLTRQDMKKDSESAKAPAKEGDNTPSGPNAKWARPPLPQKDGDAPQEASSNEGESDEAAKAEDEVKAKADEEAKAKEDEEAKEKAEAEAKAEAEKAEAEAKAKEETEKNAEEVLQTAKDEEQKAKDEAEAKEKADADAQKAVEDAKVVVEEKVKEEQEAEDKAKVEKQPEDEGSDEGAKEEGDNEEGDNKEGEEEADEADTEATKRFLRR